MSDLPDAGWYKDPGGEHAPRWWDGERWTEQVSDRRGNVASAALPTRGAAEAWAERQDRRPRFSAWIALLGVGMFVVASIVAGLFAWAGDSVGPAASLLAGAVGNYGVLFLTCWWVSRWKGTGDVWRDFGVRGRRADLYRGPVTWVAALAASIATAIVVTAIFTDRYVGSNGDMFDDHKDSATFLVTAAVVALTLAPFFEELYFRGLLLLSFEGSFPPPVAIGAQGVLFGLAHFGGADQLAGNLGLCASLAAVGVVFGICSRRYHRLVPNMLAHCCFNLPSIIILFANR